MLGFCLKTRLIKLCFPVSSVFYTRHLLGLPTHPYTGNMFWEVLDRDKDRCHLQIIVYTPISPYYTLWVRSAAIPKPDLVPIYMFAVAAADPLPNWWFLRCSSSLPAAMSSINFLYTSDFLLFKLLIKFFVVGCRMLSSYKSFLKFFL